MTVEPRRLIVAITGASGVIFGIRALQVLKDTDIETHLIVTAGGRATITQETGFTPRQVAELADVVHSDGDLTASISSGSFRTMGMLVAPCSIKTLSGVANSYDTNLVVRAADVSLKERRTLVLLLRETPLHAGHLDLALRAANTGAVIFPPVPAFYQEPVTINDLVDQTINRALDQFGLDVNLAPRWEGPRPRRQATE